MTDYNSYKDVPLPEESLPPQPGSTGRFNFLPSSPSLKAALIFAVPFTIVDFFNYYSAGTSLALSLPVLAIFYAGCGALAAKFDSDSSSNMPIKSAIFAGILTWVFSTVINSIIAIAIGATTLGTTLFLGIPYLCCCAPLQLVGGVGAGALGGFIYQFFYSNKPKKSSGQDYYTY